MTANNSNEQIESTLKQIMDIYGESPVFSTEQQWRNLLSYSSDQPVVIVNLMQLAKGELHDETLGFRGSATQAQAKYVEKALPIVHRLGIEMFYYGESKHTVIGVDEDWDLVGLVRYPSAQAFIDLHMDPTYCEQALPYRRLFTQKHLMLLSEQINNG